MKIEQLLEVLLEKNIFLKANLGELEIDAPDGIVNEILLQEIKNNKEGLIELLQESVKSFSIPLESKKDVYLLSNAQRRLWILDQFEQDSIAYNMPMSFILEGELKTDAFRQAYSFMLERHESLRTVFVVKDGKPRQKILKNPGFDIDIIDLRNSLDVENEAGVLAEKDHQTPFNLNTGPLIRYTILQLEDEKFLLLFNMHHIISDEWSMDIFIKEFLISYESFKEGNTPELAPLRIHYKDYSAWQNNLLDSHEMENQREYWLGKLSGELPFLDLPTDNVRPDTQTFNGKSFGFFLTEEKNSRLNDLCLENKASLFMMLQALVKVLFYRYTGQTDIILGSPVAGRVHGELENQIGFYVNTLILRDTIENHLTFNKFLKSVKKTCTDAYDNQDYPFDKLVDELDIKRDMSHSPLFDIMVVLQNNDEVFDELDGLILSPYSIENTISKFDMTFNFSERGEGLFCSIEYNTDIYSVDRIKRMAKHLEILISSVIENP
ncbi:MAG: non-ribosomal peptide synthetase, partial [bacterium]|nr:non-ribosomal peptide synthetase [bacterium]